MSRRRSNCSQPSRWQCISAHQRQSTGRESTGQPKDEPMEEAHLLMSAKERAAQMKQILDEVEQTLVEHHVRAAPTRTDQHLWPEC
eukprot:595424-Amphidinium_carterae.1